MKLYLLNLHWYVVLEGPVFTTVFLFWDWQKATSSVCYLDLMERKETVFLGKSQTHPASTLHFKMPDLQTMNF